MLGHRLRRWTSIKPALCVGFFCIGTCHLAFLLRTQIAWTTRAYDTPPIAHLHHNPITAPQSARFHITPHPSLAFTSPRVPAGLFGIYGGPWRDGLGCTSQTWTIYRWRGWQTKSLRGYTLKPSSLQNLRGIHSNPLVSSASGGIRSNPLVSKTWEVHTQTLWSLVHEGVYGQTLWSPKPGRFTFEPSGL